MISVAIKTSVMIALLVPALGLFNVLRHYQGELLPYKVISHPPQHTTNTNFFGTDQDPLTFPMINVTQDLMYYSNATPIAWSKITRFDYTDLKNPVKPPLTLYTGFSTKVYLAMFWVVVLLQPLIIYFVKKYSNPKPFDRLDWLNKIIHSMENSQIPSPMEDFEELPGSVNQHIERSQNILKEMGLTILANCFYHLIMLIPIFILCKFTF